MHPRLLLIIVAVLVALTPAHGEAVFTGKIIPVECNIPEMPTEDAIELPQLYDPEGRIDPFALIFQKSDVVITPTKPKVPETALTKWALSQYILTAVITRASGNVAFLTTPDNTEAYVARIGDWVGQDGAKIKSINRSIVMLTTGYAIKEVR